MKIKNLSILVCVLASMFSNVIAQNQKPKNVLFIGVDDLRPELNCYGESHIVSPNIDKLASQGVAFDNAYCNVPVCGASRASMFSGIRPTHEKFLDVSSRIDQDAPGTITIPGWFKKHGYISTSYGKTIHGHGDMEQDWSKEPFHDRSRDNPKGYVTKENLALMKKGDPKKKIGNSTEIANVGDYEYSDGKIVLESIKDMDKFVASGKPFFMAVGFRKPHLPFAAPKKYWDLYDRANLPLSLSPKQAKGAPKGAIHTWGELRAYKDIPRDRNITDLGEAKTRELIHGYSACVSYTDAMIGKLIDHLEAIGQRENTIIVLWSDHGWSLGDHELWCKHSTYDVSLRVPMIVSAPQFKKEAGKRAKGIVELVDLYPTLCDLADIEKPSHLEGESFVSLVKNPSETLSDDAAYIRWKNSDAIKTQDYLYTEWYNKKDGKYYSDMLYDHKNDRLETVNISKQPKHKEEVKKLSEKIKVKLEELK